MRDQHRSLLDEEGCSPMTMTAEAALRYAMLRPLEGAHYISLTTFRRDGTPVATPVWFAAQNATIFVYTESQSGKVKRLRHTPQVTLAPCTARGEEIGPTIVGTGRVIADHAEARRAGNALARKYGWRFRFLRACNALAGGFRRAPSSRWIYLAITPQP
jgi:PPOX class probable F420-dependent enzyme